MYAGQSQNHRACTSGKYSHILGWNSRARGFTFPSRLTTPLRKYPRVPDCPAATVSPGVAYRSTSFTCSRRKPLGTGRPCHNETVKTRTGTIEKSAEAAATLGSLRQAVAAADPSTKIVTRINGAMYRV
ncbi:hypothetical protein SBA2_670037 [Acidobacteriia bacterium SbA2]|nr:hypothetical protein SBA2_670037 [Acidobacteriia bacterium SbA2]